MSLAKNTSANTQTTTNSSTQLTVPKKLSAIEVCLKGEKFSGVPDQCIDLTRGDLLIYANNHSLINDERSQ